MTSREPKQNDCMKPSDNSERYYSPALTNYKTEIRRTEMNCLRDWSMHQGLLTLKPAQCLVHSRSLHAKELQVSGEQVDRELDKAWQKPQPWWWSVMLRLPPSTGLECTKGKVMLRTQNTNWGQTETASITWSVTRNPDGKTAQFCPTRCL